LNVILWYIINYLFQSQTHVFEVMLTENYQLHTIMNYNVTIMQTQLKLYANAFVSG